LQRSYDKKQSSMNDKLKDFITTHREEFDSFEPRDLWSGISEELGRPASEAPRLNRRLWKYFGWSAIILAGSLCIHKVSRNSDEGLCINPVLTADRSGIESSEAGNHPQQEGFIFAGDQPSSYGSKDAESPNNKQQAVVIMGEEEHTGSGEPLLNEINSTGSYPAAETTPPSASKDSGEVYRRSWESSSKEGRNVNITADTSFSGIKKLEVSGNVCNVKVRAGTGKELKFKGKIKREVKGFTKNLSTNYKITCLREGDVLKVAVSYDGKCEGSVIGVLIYETMLDFEIPSATSEVIINNTSGDVSVSGIKAEQLGITTTTGDIGTGSVQASITAGSESGHQLHMNVTGNLKARSSHGEVAIKAMKGNADIETTSGYQLYENVTGRIICASRSGEINIKSLSGTVHASSVSGYISGKNILLTGSSELSSESGEISFYLLNDLKELSFDLHTESGDIMMEKGNTRLYDLKNYNVKNGPILIKGSTKQGHQFYY
jgi:hypothetical protein